MTPIAAAAAAKVEENPNGATLVLLVVAVLLLALGLAAIVFLARTRPTASPVNPDEGQDALLQMLLASQAPALREYLKQTPNPSNPTDTNSEAIIQRIAAISLPTPAEEAVPPTLNDIVLALALLESRLGRLTTTAVRIEEQSVTKDRMVWAVLGVLGAIIGILGGLVALAAATVGLVAPS